MPEISFSQVLDFIGTIAFAISGIRLASRKMTNETMAYMDYEPYGIQSEPLKYHEEEDSNDSL